MILHEGRTNLDDVFEVGFEHAYIMRIGNFRCCAREERFWYEVKEMDVLGRVLIQ